MGDRCAPCHADTTGPFPLLTLADFASRKDRIAEVVESGAMPPWPPVTCCQRYVGDRSLSPEQRAMLLQWLIDDTPAGPDPELKATPTPVRALPRVDLALDIGVDFTPEPDEDGDENRCFLLEWPFDAPRFLTGVALHPGDLTIAHHAFIVAVDAATAEQYANDDRQDGRPGFACPDGVPRRGFSRYLAAWAPGVDPMIYPPGRGDEVAADDGIVLAVHYHAHDATGSLGPQRPGVELMVADEVEVPVKMRSVFDPMWPVTLHIGAGEASSTAAYLAGPNHVAQPTPFKIIAIGSHMHERGRSSMLGIRRADGTSTCLLQIDAWDFDWQNGYLLEEPVTVNDGDQLYIECTWDNSGPDIHGENPRDLRWGAQGEMCISWVTYEAPR